jgi:hypothetical protein
LAKYNQVPFLAPSKTFYFAFLACPCPKDTGKNSHPLSLAYA